jgi:hypothetical protein
MWSLIKSLLLVAIVGAVAYVVFFVPVGGATLADHGREVWRSSIVQQKVQKVRSGMRDELEERLGHQETARGSTARPGTPRPGTARPQHASAADEIPDTDRKALDQLLVNLK